MPTYTLYADATRHEGRRYVKGDQIELDERVGKRLTEQGLVGPPDSEPPAGAGSGVFATAGLAPVAAERSTTGPAQTQLADDDDDPRTRSRISSGGQVAAATDAEVTSDIPSVDDSGLAKKTNDTPSSSAGTGEAGSTSPRTSTTTRKR